MRDIAKRTKTVVIGISEPKLLALFLIQRFTLKITKFFVSIHISKEEVLLVTLEVILAINSVIFCIFKLKISHSIITIGIIWRPPNQSKFLDIFEEYLSKLNISYCEI